MIGVFSRRIDFSSSFLILSSSTYDSFRLAKKKYKFQGNNFLVCCSTNKQISKSHFFRFISIEILYRTCKLLTNK